MSCSQNKLKSQNIKDLISKTLEYNVEAAGIKVIAIY